MNELLIAAKDEAAREYGYPNFGVAATFSAAHVLIDRALEIYGDAQWNEAIEKAEECEALNFADYDKKQSIRKLKI